MPDRIHEIIVGLLDCEVCSNKDKNCERCPTVIEARYALSNEIKNKFTMKNDWMVGKHHMEEHNNLVNRIKEYIKKGGE